MQSVAGPLCDNAEGAKGFRALALVKCFRKTDPPRDGCAILQQLRTDDVLAIDARNDIPLNEGDPGRGASLYRPDLRRYGQTVDTRCNDGPETD